MAYVDIPDTYQTVKTIVQKTLITDKQKTHFVKTENGFYRFEYEDKGWNTDEVYFRILEVDDEETRIEIEYNHKDGKGATWDTFDMLEFGRTNNSAQSAEMLNAQAKVSRWLVKFIEMFDDEYHIHYGKT
jgi:major membrane immunogen (membrane-anchored lipoprotein)